MPIRESIATVISLLLSACLCAADPSRAPYRILCSFSPTISVTVISDVMDRFPFPLRDLIKWLPKEFDLPISLSLRRFAVLRARPSSRGDYRRDVVCLMSYFPHERTGLPTQELTIAEMLKPAGYVTGCVGKWHLGGHPELRPQQQGFDEYFGMLHTNDIEEWKPGLPFHQLSSLEAMSLLESNTVIESPVDQALLTQKYTERGIEFIRKHHEQPFFLYLAHTMPHVPQYASPLSLESQRPVYMGIVSKNWIGARGAFSMY